LKQECALVSQPDAGRAGSKTSELSRLIHFPTSWAKQMPAAAEGIINRSNTHFRFVAVAAAHLSMAAPVRDWAVRRSEAANVLLASWHELVCNSTSNNIRQHFSL